MEQDTRNILKNHFGMTDEELDRLDIGAKKCENKTEPSENNQKKEEYHPHDPLYSGLKTERTATHWRDFMEKSVKYSNERLNQYK